MVQVWQNWLLGIKTNKVNAVEIHFEEDFLQQRMPYRTKIEYLYELWRRQLHKPSIRQWMVSKATNLKKTIIDDEWVKFTPLEGNMWGFHYEYLNKMMTAMTYKPSFHNAKRQTKFPFLQNRKFDFRRWGFRENC